MYFLFPIGLNGLLWEGYRRPLDLDDMYPLQNRYKTMPLVDQFEKMWKEEQNAYDAAMKSMNAGGCTNETTSTGFSFFRRKRKPPSAPSVIRIIHRMYGSEFYPLGLVRF